MITVPMSVYSSHSDASYLEQKTVTDLYKQMKEQNHIPPTRSVSNAGNLTSLCVDISPSSSNFFEVLYIGKIKVWQKSVPETFVDEALEKFRLHELEKSKVKQIGNIGRLPNENNIQRRGSIDSTNSESSSTDGSIQTVPQMQRSVSYQSNLLQRELSELKNLPSIQILEEQGSNDENSTEVETVSEPAPSKNSKTIDVDDHNRTMVLQVDRTDLRLISPDRKLILLHKHHRDVTTCMQGSEKAEHFGFVCREGKDAQVAISYIFKCESPSIASDAVAAITQAFLNSESKPRPAITSCDHCPMVWFHKLCAEIEHMSDRKTQAAIFRRIEQLDIDEQNTILTKFRGVETDTVRDQNEFLMALLRAHCEMKQGRHVHDTAENRSEFLSQYLGVGGNSMFTKAKRSLTSSFDQILKRKASKDDFSSTLKGMNLPITNNLNRENSQHSPAMGSTNDISDKDSEGSRSRSSTIGSQSDLREQNLNIKENNKNSVSPDRNVPAEKGLKSPMMDIFLKVGNSPKSTSSNEDSPSKMDTGSWRQAIFKRVITPNKQDSDEPTAKKTKKQLRELWKEAIRQAILLVRMEKENARLKAEQEESAVKRIKLEYDEMKPNQREVMEVWDMVTSKAESRIKCDRQLLLQAIRQGVPRGKRGEVWQFLAEQFCMKVPPIDTVRYPNYNVPYETLLKQLTSHQHAILIDLGRTFPNHSYFSSPLGPGQLALFNLLKAYSLLDSEVGYCQGLSFVAGVLLLHMEEHQAFFLLRHLMFRRDLRNQYLPDMIGLQVKLYQLSRLLHDQVPELYNHFDFYEVPPTLYAAPWLLTIFASQFPLGFVTRVFDLIFLEGPEIIFKVALALLTYHKDKILKCDGFEEIMRYLKEELPSLDKPTLDKIMKQVYTTDIKKQLDEYKVEYHVLQEEMSAVQPQVEALQKLEKQNRTLTEQNKALMGQLEMSLSNVQRLEKTRVLQQSQLNRLEMQTRAQEVTIAALANFVNTVIEKKVDIEIPEDVQRIMAQISLTERRKLSAAGQTNFMKMFQKPENKPEMVKSLSTGIITMPDSDSMARSNSLNVQNFVPQKDLKTQTQVTPTGSTEKKSNFFSSSLQQKISNSQNNICIKVQDFENNRRNMAHEKSISLPLENDSLCNDKPSPTNSIDSGVGTPISPKMISSHPLSNCGDVSFTFSGTRELKTIKTLKNTLRNSSPDIIGK